MPWTVQVGFATGEAEVGACEAGWAAWDLACSVAACLAELMPSAA
nr:MAG TPA: hypothetical protein [Caudoviricetes sp.]